MSAEQKDCGQTAPAPPDPAASLAALSWCLRAVAQGWTLDPRERTAAIELLAGGIPGVDAADLATATKLIERAAKRTLSTRDRDRASALSVRLSEQAACLQESEP
jgi:hypothetical protein